jgi:hypothetical protein
MAMCSPDRQTRAAAILQLYHLSPVGAPNFWWANGLSVAGPSHLWTRTTITVSDSPGHACPASRCQWITCAALDQQITYLRKEVMDL